MIMQKLELTHPEIKIQNIVCTADLKQKIDIESFNEYEFLSSNLKLYHCGYVKDNSMKGKVSVFKSGKMISIGTKNPDDAKKELRKVSRILQKHKFSKPVKIYPQVRNIVAGFNLNRKLPIEKLARTFPRCMYEPDQFPALIYRIQNSCTSLIFSSGKGIIVGAKSLEEINFAFFEIKSRI